MKQIQAKEIFIDLDDTIWDFTGNSKIALKEVMQKSVLKLTDEEYAKFLEAYLFKNNELWELYHYGKIEKDYLVTERFRYALAEINYKNDNIKGLSALLNESYLNTLAQLPTIVEGARELLEYLQKKYGKVGVLSNGFKGIQAMKLKSGGLDKYIDLLVLSDEIGITKPLRGIFDYAMNKRGVKPEEIVMIGDNYDADICGAKNAGWQTVFFNRKGVEVDGEAADATVNKLIEIKNIL